MYIPKGTYRFTSTIQLKAGIVLRGAGADKSFLKCDLGESARTCIEVITYQRGNFVPILNGLEKGSTVIEVADAGQFAAGDTAEIQQENDPAIMYTSPDWDQPWAQNAVGQFLRILLVDGNTLTIDRPLHMDFRAELNPVIRPNKLVENVGLEDFQIERPAAGEGHTIQIKNAANSWVRRIESAYTYNSHVSVTSSMNIEIRENYFHHSHDYGGGGHGYGVDLVTHTTSCLVENNIFEHLRHSMMAHVGANGNVFAYNYSFDPFQNSGTWTPTDISIHGHFQFMNLFEGNIVQEIGIADYWGPAGPGNTFFRNRVEAENIDVMDHSHDQNIIGNELVGPAGTITVGPDIIGTIIHGNNIRGTLSWDPDIPDHILPNSYYLLARPAFFGNMEWPSIGGDQEIGTGTIPAKVRYEDGFPIPPVPPKPAEWIAIMLLLLSQ